MWRFQSAQLPNGRGLRFAVDLQSQSATFADVVCAWQQDASFRSRFNAELAGAPYTAFRWETPPVTAATATKPFEFVLLDSPQLAHRADPNAFASHFAKELETTVVAFPNLGGDAVLVVPCPVAEPPAYAHLASFVREAPETQRSALWQLVGATMAKRLSGRPVWLSTAGAGVAWLHVRLDDRPKYYGFTQYKQSG